MRPIALAKFPVPTHPQYIFTDNPHKSVKKNAKVRVEKSPISKDLFFLYENILGNSLEPVRIIFVFLG
jgi:hypothetical protein